MSFGLDDAVTLDELQRRKDDGVGFDDIIIDIDRMFDCYKKVSVSPAQSKRFFNGGALDCGRVKSELTDGEVYRVYDSDDCFLGLGKCTDGQLTVARILSKRD